MKNLIMNPNESNDPFNLLNLLKKIGLCLLVILIITFYMLCYQHLSL
ncbi:hypothetical protein [Flavobacterium psychrolimnae]|nr:hypothetical protein [Flavobacterium psychrolimnae]